MCLFQLTQTTGVNQVATMEQMMNYQFQLDDSESDSNGTDDELSPRMDMSFSFDNISMHQKTLWQLRGFGINQIKDNHPKLLTLCRIKILELQLERIDNRLEYIEQKQKLIDQRRERKLKERDEIIKQLQVAQLRKFLSKQNEMTDNVQNVTIRLAQRRDRQYRFKCRRQAGLPPKPPARLFARRNAIKPFQRKLPPLNYRITSDNQVYIIAQKA
eukprot:173829_1